MPTSRTASRVAPDIAVTTPTGEVEGVNRSTPVPQLLAVQEDAGEVEAVERDHHGIGTQGRGESDRQGRFPGPRLAGQAQQEPSPFGAGPGKASDQLTEWAGERRR